MEAGAARARVLVVLFALPRGLVYIGGHKRPRFRKPNRTPYTNPIQTPHAKLERKKNTPEGVGRRDSSASPIRLGGRRSPPSPTDSASPAHRREAASSSSLPMCSPAFFDGGSDVLSGGTAAAADSDACSATAATSSSRPLRRGDGGDLLLFLALPSRGGLRGERARKVVESRTRR